jgi:DNA (cytosine-5)-methyltransferase 1
VAAPITVAEALTGLPRLQVRQVASGDLARIVPQLKPGEKASRYHPKGYYFNTYRLHWDKPAFNLVRCCSPSRVLLLHPEEDRGISIDEAKRLQSFPDQFTLLGNHTIRWGFIGDSLPPLAMRAVILHLRQCVFRGSGAEPDLQK